ncbi:MULTISPECIES: ROK family transcriptional regulator [Eisenbergiella]|uniref:ROK family transcriptional regulator n=1 Tax=Eisenbergiella TaxID=1432051 RepID=UPI0023EFFCBC|nr:MULTISPECIES: ROK family transcriptional regulator [Eisenbergiella]MCI6709436.1 ROK family transcriptional regulator [Eisenbergiella massiliensis]MDY5525568.1 ROK family transcriptional regulator [Eisenbergiella porci]
MKLVNQQLIKNTNLKLLYNSIFENRGISRAALAKKTGLSRTAVSALIDELTESGFLYDSGTGDSAGVGRKPNCLELCSGNHYIAVFGWEEKRVHAQLIDICGSPLLQQELYRTPGDSYTELCHAFLEERMLKLIRSTQLLGICFVLPAMIDPEKETVFSTTISLEQDQGETGVIPLLRETFSSYAAAVLNDTACAAYAEKVYTAILEKDYAFIRFSRGIGAALFIQDRLLGRACASYTQFGHFSISPQGPHCPCGNNGCLELVLSEEALPGRLHAEGTSSSLLSLPSISYADLGRSALYGDQTAIQVIRKMAREFSFALSNLICLVHPRLIVLGGNACTLGPVFLEEIRLSLQETGFRRMTENVRIRYSGLDAYACYNGAMKYFFDIHYQFTGSMKGSFFIG